MAGTSEMKRTIPARARTAQTSRALPLEASCCGPNTDLQTSRVVLVRDRQLFDLVLWQDPLNGETGRRERNIKFPSDRDLRETF